MAETFIRHGVPKSIAQDSWWLDSPSAAMPDDANRTQIPPARRSMGLLALIVLADVLFWSHTPGLSLVLYAWAVFAVVSLLRPKAALGPFVLLILGSLPVIDYAQLLSVAVLNVALLVAVVWTWLPKGGLAMILTAAIRLLGRLPFHGLIRAVQCTWRLTPLGVASGFLRRMLQNWAFPVGGTAVFAALLINANPLIARLVTFDANLSDLVPRSLFWLGIGLMLWPLIGGKPPSADPFRKLPRLPHLGINATSTLRALWMFNLLIGVQTLMDLTILLGGASLPLGMSHATYAHRGAYPLLATALLAGTFALAARPYLAEHRALKPLLLLWLAQNVALSLSAALRLHLYIAAFGLTYLRVDALIWMALVAAGLALTGWQVWRGRSNGWLAMRTCALGFGVLYGCCFVNFAAVIAATNLAQSDTNLDYFDWSYLRDLGPMASGATEAAFLKDPVLRKKAEAAGFYSEPPAAQGWREWGFRNASVLHYLAEAKRQDVR